MKRTIPCLVFTLISACSNQPTPQTPTPTTHPTVGLLVMAHGGDPSWNGMIREAAEPLRSHWPTALAFGMANELTLAAGLDSLSRQGVTRVAVVRLFVSGRSFLERTAALLDLEFPSGPDAANRGAATAPIPHALEIATHLDGLAAWSGIGPLITQRALQASENRARHSVLIVAHGAGDDEENAGLLARMDYAAKAIRAAGFFETHVATLREDWPEARAQAERGIREFVQRQNNAGHSVIVVPFRVSGFGPYAEVLSGLSFIRAESFLPHPAITDWMKQTATEIMCGNGWRSQMINCRPAFLATSDQH